MSTTVLPRRSSSDTSEPTGPMPSPATSTGRVTPGASGRSPSASASWIEVLDAAIEQAHHEQPHHAQHQDAGHDRPHRAASVPAPATLVRARLRIVHPPNVAGATTAGRGHSAGRCRSFDRAAGRGRQSGGSGASSRSPRRAMDSSNSPAPSPAPAPPGTAPARAAGGRRRTLLLPPGRARARRPRPARPSPSGGSEPRRRPAAGCRARSRGARSSAEAGVSTLMHTRRRAAPAPPGMPAFSP